MSDITGNIFLITYAEKTNNRSFDNILMALFSYQTIVIMTIMRLLGKMMKGFKTSFSATSDTIIFMFLGMALVSKDHIWHPGFILWTIGFCLIFRFIGKEVTKWFWLKGLYISFIIIFPSLNIYINLWYIWLCISCSSILISIYVSIYIM